MMIKASKENNKANPLNANDPLFNMSSLLHLLVIGATPNPVPVSAAGVVLSVAGDSTSFFGGVCSEFDIFSLMS